MKFCMGHRIRDYTVGQSPFFNYDSLYSHILVELLNTLVKDIGDEMVHIYIIPLHYQALLLSGNSTAEQRGALVQRLELTDDLTYYSCLWDEFLFAGESRALSE